MRRRALLGSAAALAAGPARAQVSTLNLRAEPLAVALDDWVADGYRREVLIRWGDRVVYDAPDWAPQSPTPQAAAAQFGWDGRLACLVSPPVASDNVPRLVMVALHPRVVAPMAWPGGRDRPAIAAAMQGASVVNLEKQGSRWVVVDGGFQSRRLHGDTLCRWSGPAATTPAVQGVLGPEAGCATPWGSALLAESDPTEWLARLRGLDARWQDAARFGWVVEFDPLDPQSVPVKRSALGRIGAGGAGSAGGVAAAVAGDGRAVVFLADGRPMGFLYRFVSANAAGGDALDSGTLSVAKAEGDGVRWVALPAGSALDLTGAAERAGAARFDTPSGLVFDARGERLFLACRAGTTRSWGQVDALNPRSGPNAGHVLEIAGEPSADRMAARVLLRAEGPMANPATLTLDGRGRIWIGTDCGGVVGAAPDALFGCDLDGAGRGVARPLYAAPRAGAIGGAAMVPGDDQLLVMVRTPGASPGASFDNPATRWPAFEPAVPPRTTLVSIARTRGGVVGG
jgi:secreted PhoX family phosphatase